MRSQIIFELVICNLHTKKIKTSLQKKKKKKKDKDFNLLYTKNKK
jgi:hypothetical protein